MGKRNSGKVSMEKLIELKQSVVAVRARNQQWLPDVSSCQRDPGIAHRYARVRHPGDTSRIHINFGNSRGETYVLS